MLHMKANDPKSIVAQGYDRIADAYLARFGQSTVRDANLAVLLKELPAGAMVLDLGCGAGEPVARELVAHGFRVTGVDPLGKSHAPGGMSRKRALSTRI
jgi:SAM-dependent methyltransferase